MRRVLVTGAGLVMPTGTTLDSFWTALLSGTGRFAEAMSLPGSRIVVSELADSTPLIGLPGVNDAASDRSARLAVAATRRAIDHSGLAPDEVRGERVAVIVGCGGGGLTSMDEQYRRLYREQQARAHPFTVPRAMVSSSASWVSIATGATGPCFVVSSACASAAHAIGLGLQFVRSGLADIALVGGTESCLNEGTLRAWDALRVMSPTVCRPFAKGRQGLILAEAAGMLVLEAEERVVGRGGRPLGEIAGFACNADATDIVAPSPDGMTRAMRLALADAKLAPEAIDYVNAHGTGTLSNDRAETAALKAVFGERDQCPPVSSIKAVTGHSLGASGAIEAIATLLAIANAIAPPTANLDVSDPQCDLDYVPNTPRPLAIRSALSNSFAFGGLNAALVLRAA